VTIPHSLDQSISKGNDDVSHAEGFTGCIPLATNRWGVKDVFNFKISSEKNEFFRVGYV
jgi:hypothetical protein